MIPTPTLENINTEDGLNVFMNIVNSSSKPLNDGMFLPIIRSSNDLLQKFKFYFIHVYREKERERKKKIVIKEI